MRPDIQEAYEVIVSTASFLRGAKNDDRMPDYAKASMQKRIALLDAMANKLASGDMPDSE